MQALSIPPAPGLSVRGKSRDLQRDVRRSDVVEDLCIGSVYNDNVVVQDLGAGFTVSGRFRGCYLQRLPGVRVRSSFEIVSLFG